MNFWGAFWQNGLFFVEWLKYEIGITVAVPIARLFYLANDHLGQHSVRVFPFTLHSQHTVLVCKEHVAIDSFTIVAVFERPRKIIIDRREDKPRCIKLRAIVFDIHQLRRMCHVAVAF